MSKLFSPLARSAVASFGFAGCARLGVLGAGAQRNISSKIATIPAFFHEKYTDLAQQKTQIYLPIAESLELQNGAKQLQQDLESQKRKGCEQSANILQTAKEFAQEKCPAVLFTNAILPLKTANIDVASQQIGSEKPNGADIDDARVIIENAPNLMFFAHLLRMCGQETYYNISGNLFAKPYYVITGKANQSPHVDGFGLSNSVNAIILHAIATKQQCETAVIDSAQVLKLLSPEAIEQLQQPIFYYASGFNNFRDAFDTPHLVPIITQDKKGKLKINYDSSAVAIRSSFESSMALDEISAASIEVMKRRENVYNLKSEESLLLDNYQVMHARNEAKKLAPDATEDADKSRKLLRTFYTKVASSAHNLAHD